MGSSTSKYGSIFVRTEKPYYFSGEGVTGTFYIKPKGNVYLNIVENGFPGHSIFLKIKGKEQCHWEEHRQSSRTNADGTSSSETIVDHYHGRNQFYSHRILLHQFDGKFLPCGQYVFPFQFQIFGHLPGSFHEKGNRYSASIIYKVKAEVDSFEKNSKKIKHHQELIVREPLKNQLQSMEGRISVRAKTFCCINQGESQIKCVFDKNAYLPGDQALLQIDIDNSECNLDVNEIRAALTQNITLRSNQGRQHVVNSNLVTHSIDGIPARSHAKDEYQKKMQVVLLNQSARGDERILRPSTNGSLVKSQYNLSVTAVLSGCTCCATHPTVSVPINIVSPVPVQYAQIQQAPADWNPQTFQPILVHFNDSDRYAKDPSAQQNFNYPSQNENVNTMSQDQGMNQNNNNQNNNFNQNGNTNQNNGASQNTKYQYNGPS